MSLSVPVPRQPTISLAKRGQVVRLSLLKGENQFSLSQIAALTGIAKTTCQNIIAHAKQQSIITGNTDLCAEENNRPLPNSLKGCNEALTAIEKQHLIDITLASATNCRLPFGEIANVANLPVSRNTVKKILAADGINRREPTNKPLLNDNQKTAQLEFCLAY